MADDSVPSDTAKILLEDALYRAATRRTENLTLMALVEKALKKIRDTDESLASEEQHFIVALGGIGLVDIVGVMDRSANRLDAIARAL